MKNLSLYNSASEVSTLGWDTVYAITFTSLNNAIMKDKTYPTNFNWFDKNDNITIDGDWLSWQLCPGGAGQNVQMKCIVNKGEVIYSDGNDSITADLSEASLIIQVNLQKIPTTDYVIDKTATSIGETYKLLIDGSGVGEDPAVSIINSTYPNVKSGLIRDVLDLIFKRYFNAHIMDFNNTFSVMNINEVADKDSFQWIKPTFFTYAVSSGVGSSIDNCVFGLLAMVQNNQVSPGMQQAIDSRIMINLASGANSAFVIGETLMVSNIIKNCAVGLIQGSTADDFSISVDGLSVYNNKKITWGNFETKDGVISPSIEINNFIVRAESDYIYAEIVDAYYSPSAGVNAYINYSQKFTFDTVKRQKDDEYTFIPSTSGFGAPNIHISVTTSEGMIIAQIVLGVVAGAAALLGGISEIGSLIGKCAETSVEETSAAIELTDFAMETAMNGEIATPEGAAAVNAAEMDAAQNVTEGILSGSSSFIQKGGIFFTPKFRTWCAIIAALTGVPAASIGIIPAIQKDLYDDLPGLNELADNFMGGIKWPELTTYKLVGAAFCGSLVLSIQLE